MRIFIADEELKARRILVRTLEELGHEVSGEAASGDDLLREMKRARPDLVILDLDLPGPESDEVIRELVERSGLGVVVLSSHVEPHDAAVLARAGVAAVVRKPFNRRDLGIAIELSAARSTEHFDLRRQAEEVQIERVRLLQVFADSADGVYIAGSDGRMLMANEAALRLLGMEEAGMRGRQVASWTLEFRPRNAEGKALLASEMPLSRALGGEVVREIEIWIDALDGEVRCLSLSASPVMGTDGQVVEALALLRDVTDERMREQELLERAERRRRELTQLSCELLAAHNAEDLSQRCVATVRAAMGADRVQMIGTVVEGKSYYVAADTARPPRKRSSSQTRISSTPTGRLGLAHLALTRHETVCVADTHAAPSGATIAALAEAVDATNAAKEDADGRAAMAAPMTMGDRVLGALVCTWNSPQTFQADDAHLVTLLANQAAVALENLRLAGRIADQQKLAALGTMAAGIVHEIKNPLVYVRANVESALELLEKIVADPTHVDVARAKEDRDALAEAQSGCDRVFKIVDDIKTYAHPGRTRREPCDINKLVEISLTLAASELRKWCKVTRDFGELPRVLCDGAKISQVVLNLLVNAAQALQAAGETSRKLGRVTVSTLLEEGAVHIVVADDGPGMSPDVVDKIFLPFFTTKPAGVGTGLGLSICKSLMESQDGTLEVESSPGAGSRFTLILPLPRE